MRKSILKYFKAFTLIGISVFFGKREIKELPDILMEGEKSENMIQGTLENGSGILVCTNKRVIFIDKGLLSGLKVVDYPFDKTWFNKI